MQVLIKYEKEDYITMMFKTGTAVYAYEVMREAGQNVMYINYLGSSFVPSIADSPDVMARTVDDLIESSNVSRIVFVQQRNYNYDFSQISYLLEVAQIYTYLIKQEKILSSEKLGFCPQCLGKRHESMTYFSMLLKRDPIAAYHEIKRMLRQARADFEKANANCKTCDMSYTRLLEKISAMLENLRIIKEGMPYFDSYKFGDREIYGNFFRPDTIPNFTFTRLVATLPEDAEIIEQYTIAEGYDKSTVTILKKKNESKFIYHLMPPEYSLDEDHHYLLNLARNVLIEHRPKSEEFSDVERTRQVFFNVSRDLLQELAEARKVSLTYSELNKLAGILVRYTIGFGLIEVLLQDEKLQDIVLNAPIALNPIFLRHAKFDECVTNIIPSQEDADSWAAKFRMLSGRPLDEANPILDTDLSLGKIRARVAVIQQPLSPHGLAYALRRHRDEPWTLPLFVKNKMLNSFSAGLLSFLIDGSRTLLVAGTRSAGKCVRGDTLIQLANGDIKTIKEIEHGKSEKIPDGWIFYPNPDINVLSLNESLNIERTTVNVSFRRNAPKEMVEIKTASGKEIFTTKEHPYFTFDKKLKPILAGQLKKGNLIATPRRIQTFSEEVNLSESKEICQQIRTNAKKIRFPEKLNSELAEFLGYLVGDGHIDEHKLEFTNCDSELRKRFAVFARNLFSVSSREIKSRNTFNVQITSRILNRAINKLFDIPFGNKAAKIKIPSKILISDDSILASFLRAYFDCDGSVISGKREIEIATASKDMSRQLQMALLRFGIISFVKKKIVRGSEYYRLFIRGEFFKIYAEKIGFNHKLKKQRLMDLLNKKWIDNTNIDIIPGGNYYLKELRAHLRVSPSEVRNATGKDYWAYENEKYNVSRKWFKILTEFYESRFNHLCSLKARVARLCGKSEIKDFEEFRNLLNISNEEFAEKVSLATVTNLFNYVYAPKLETKTLIASKIKEVYEKIISDSVLQLLKTSKSLANSDIFWDKIEEIDIAPSNVEWVYDFSVPGSENFVANGFIAHNTSLLGSLMLEIMPKFRVIVVEDTLELPVDALRKIGYDILRMKVRSALLQTTNEVAAEEGIRTSLRFGDSCLILGEVRSQEAKALYEAMRVGALANVVAGTIHGSSPYSIFDRVVNDLGVPVTSFKATDCVLVANPVKTADGMHSSRRVVQLTEVRKHWTKDPEEEKGFVDLLKYNVDKDELEPSDELINGDSEIIKEIASGVKGWAGNWDAVYDNILLRGKIKQELVDISEKMNLPEILEAKFNSMSGGAFHEISDSVRMEIGLPLSDKVFPLWQEWLKKEIKRVRVYGV